MANATEKAWLKPYRFTPGNSGGGRRSDRDLVKVVLRETRNGRELGEMLLRIARTAPRMRDRVEAIRELLNRLYGRAPEFVQVEGMNSDRFTLAELERARAEIAGDN